MLLRAGTDGVCRKKSVLRYLQLGGLIPVDVWDGERIRRALRRRREQTRKWLFVIISTRVFFPAREPARYSILEFSKARENLPLGPRPCSPFALFEASCRVVFLVF